MSSPYKIYLKSYTGTKVKLPIVPAELPEISYTSDISDFTAVKGGHYSIIGQMQQPTVSVEHMIPEKGKTLSFAVSKTTGSQVLKILRECQRKRIPMKYIIAKKSGGYYLNRWFAVSSFSYHVDKKNDYIISMELVGWQSYKDWKKAAAL